MRIMRFNPYEGLEVIATGERSQGAELSEYRFNPYEGLEVIATRKRAPVRRRVI